MFLEIFHAYSLTHIDCRFQNFPYDKATKIYMADEEKGLANSISKASSLVEA